MTKKDKPQVTGVYHVGLYAKDPAALAAFYQDVMGMQVVGSSTKEDQFGTSAFLSSRPTEESHEIVFFDNPRGRHTAFKVGSLADQRD